MIPLSHYISANYLEENVLRTLKKQFKAHKPFPHLSLSHFFKKSQLCPLISELMQQQFKEHDADLYHFLQTVYDIKTSTSMTLKDFYTFFASPQFAEYMTSLTGITLKQGGIGMSGFIYRKGDYLLCHDDRLSGRKIAYVVNLSDMTEKTGGDLALMSHNNSHPGTVIKRIYPHIGMFNFFEVSKISWHQVEEVLDKQRITLAGWLHG